jgi:hypothetical protein
MPAGWGPLQAIINGLLNQIRCIREQGIKSQDQGAASLESGIGTPAGAIAQSARVQGKGPDRSYGRCQGEKTANLMGTEWAAVEPDSIGC